MRKCPVPDAHPDPLQYTTTCCRFCQQDAFPDTPLAKLPPLCLTDGVPAAATPIPCINDNGPLTGKYRKALQLYDRRNWRVCGKRIGSRTIPNHPDRCTAVCPCEGCGPSCAGYDADIPEM